MKSFISLAVILFMGVCAPVQALVPQPSTDGSQAILFNEKELSYFAGAVVASGTKDLFVGTGPWTAFIPTNEAIEKF